MDFNNVTCELFTDERDALIQAINDIVLTPQGSRVGLPRYGTIYNQFGSVNTPTVQVVLNVERSLKLNDNRIKNIQSNRYAPNTITFEINKDLRFQL